MFKCQVWATVYLAFTNTSSNVYIQVIIFVSQTSLIDWKTDVKNSLRQDGQTFRLVGHKGLENMTEGLDQK